MSTDDGVRVWLRRLGAEHDPAVADRHGAYFRELFASWAPIASEQVISDAQRVLRP
ncbi:hypothetical protein [Micromonospora foliorum]|uniref:hypothetical protein n=1 Tax=Micromonospora foliorum TaxID=2911210 RepID=UPI001EE8B8F7|nr:hypothetical protein [Micromonospora foliorum]MCG5436297.1 hypothetical protein [Micromonospora foliorum]